MSLYPSREEFLSLAETCNLVPVVWECIADADTPVSALAKLGVGSCAYLLESVEGGETLGRYSFVGNTALAVFRSKGRRVEIERPGGAAEIFEDVDPLECLRTFLQAYRPAELPGLPRFFGGAVGYVAYDGVRHLERPSDARRDELALPDAAFIITDTVLIFDHLSRKLQVVVNTPVAPDPSAAYDGALRRIDEAMNRLSSGSGLAPLSGLQPPARPAAFSSNVDRETFMASVEKAKAYIRAGDILQVVLSQRMSSEIHCRPLEIYRVLRALNPSPYMFFLQFGETAVVGSSPEVMVRVEQGKALLRPIAGTRPRGRDAAEDEALAADLLADDKERAEHLMLVDLGRSDLGRVCAPGTVHVDEFMTVERYSHVMHIVSNVTGMLDEGKDAFDLFRAAFPAGTVSGAPKTRAMEIIDELEAARRGPYAGAVGYFSFNGNMDTCITIRTVVVHRGKAYVQAGAGIVADSDPAGEYEETLNKARGVIQAIQMAEAAAGSVRSA